MSRIETNEFAITNAHELTSAYRLYRIENLNRAHPEYYANRDRIIRKLSYKLKKPVTVIERDGMPHLVVRDDAEDFPEMMKLVQVVVYFERLPGTFQLDYSLRSSENDEICLRFLQFMLQNPLYHDQKLWQPRAGQAYFDKQPIEQTDEVMHFLGYSVRAVLLPDGRLGVRIHMANKYLGRNPLPVNLSRDEFSRLPYKRYAYRYGHRWYEIKPTGLAGLNVSQYVISKGDRLVPLLDYAIEESNKPIPQELADVPHDAAVLTYLDNRDNERSAIAPLCYPVLSAHDREMQRMHGKSLIPPLRRRRLAHDFLVHHLQRLRFGNIRMRVEERPVILQPRKFDPPDLLFGNSIVLSVRGTKGAETVGLDNWGKARAELLRDHHVGFYDKDPLGRQYLILPRSVYQTWGSRFIEELISTVNRMFPQQTPYSPEIIVYNDSVPRTYAAQGNAILDAVREQCKKSGYGVVMIHHTSDQRLGKEDQLAAMLINELRDLPGRVELKVGVIHSATGRECYRSGTNKDGSPDFFVPNSLRGKLIGYFRGVALNKVLLTNGRWPFVLATPLHADRTIGVDVKHNTAGLVIVSRTGDKIRPLLKKSRHKEKLSDRQIESYLIEIIREEAKSEKKVSDKLLQVFVLHRDGKLYYEELLGVRRAMEFLRKEGTIAPDATLTVLEIPKSAMSTLRFFEVHDGRDGLRVDNPQVGLYHIIGNDGYLCTTGRAFPRRGTSNPLHIRYKEGTLSLEQCLEDIFYLAALAWAKPDDCMRDPITTKLNDRYLGEEATFYDEEALEIEATLAEEAEEEEVA
jgi:hypothetical protein